MKDNQFQEIPTMDRPLSMSSAVGLIGFIKLWFTHILSHNMKPQTFALLVIWFTLIVVF